MHSLHKHKKVLQRQKKNNNQIELKEILAEKRQSLSNLSNERAQTWANNINLTQCIQLLNGAVRETSTSKRHEFEVGNWQGQKLKGELKFYNNVYKRQYQPDAVKMINSLVYKKEHPPMNNTSYNSLAQKGGEATLRWRETIRCRSRVSETHSQRFAFGNYNSNRKQINSQMSNTKRSTPSRNSLMGTSPVKGELRSNKGSVLCGEETILDDMGPQKLQSRSKSVHPQAMRANKMLGETANKEGLEQIDSFCEMGKESKLATHKERSKSTIQKHRDFLLRGRWQVTNKVPNAFQSMSSAEKPTEPYRNSLKDVGEDGINRVRRKDKELHMMTQKQMEQEKLLKNQVQNMIKNNQQRASDLKMQEENHSIDIDEDNQYNYHLREIKQKVEEQRQMLEELHQKSLLAGVKNNMKSKQCKSMVSKHFYVNSSKFDLTATKPTNSLRQRETELHAEELSKHFDNTDQMINQNSFLDINKLKSSGSGIVVSKLIRKGSKASGEQSLQAAQSFNLLNSQNKSRAHIPQFGSGQTNNISTQSIQIQDEQTSTGQNLKRNVSFGLGKQAPADGNSGDVHQYVSVMDQTFVVNEPEIESGHRIRQNNSHKPSPERRNRIDDGLLMRDQQKHKLYLKTLEKSQVYRQMVTSKKENIQKMIDEIGSNSHFNKKVVQANIAKLSKEHKYLSLKKKFEDQRKQAGDQIYLGTRNQTAVGTQLSNQGVEQEMAPDQPMSLDQRPISDQQNRIQMKNARSQLNIINKAINKNTQSSFQLNKTEGTQFGQAPANVESSKEMLLVQYASRPQTQECVYPQKRQQHHAIPTTGLGHTKRMLKEAQTHKSFQQAEINRQILKNEAFKEKQHQRMISVLDHQKERLNSQVTQMAGNKRPQLQTLVGPGQKQQAGSPGTKRDRVAKGQPAPSDNNENHVHSSTKGGFTSIGNFDAITMLEKKGSVQVNPKMTTDSYGFHALMATSLEKRHLSKSIQRQRTLSSRGFMYPQSINNSVNMMNNTFNSDLSFDQPAAGSIGVNITNRTTVMGMPNNIPQKRIPITFDKRNTMGQNKNRLQENNKLAGRIKTDRY